MSQPFLSNARFLTRVGLEPPRVLDHAPDLGVIALEDLGDVSLRRALEAASPAERGRLLASALAALTVWQEDATRALGPDTHAHGVRFTAEVFARELSLFRDRCLTEYLGVELDPGRRATLDAELDAVARELAALPPVLTHRDYHVDNLFVTAGRLRVIDFQDARLGPAAYDPASLLGDRDVHRFAGPDEADRLLQDWLRSRRIEPASFARGYALAVLQRTLKACGTFAMQAQKGRSHYAVYIRPSLGRAARAASRLPEAGAIGRLAASLSAEPVPHSSPG